MGYCCSLTRKQQTDSLKFVVDSLKTSLKLLPLMLTCGRLHPKLGNVPLPELLPGHQVVVNGASAVERPLVLGRLASVEVCQPFLLLIEGHRAVATSLLVAACTGRETLDALRLEGGEEGLDLACHLNDHKSRGRQSKRKPGTETGVNISG
jgi:hypothetical protein